MGRVRGPELLARADNPRPFIAERYAPRGQVVDRSGQPIVTTTGQPGDYQRLNLYPPLSNVLGYNDPLYGQSGLEAEMNAARRAASKAARSTRFGRPTCSTASRRLGSMCA